jgi:hypothetical protein
MRGPIELGAEAVRKPERILPYLKRRLIDLKFSYKYREMPTLKDRIHKFINQDKFALVILDATRYDYFEEEVDDYLAGDLEKVYTPKTYTMKFLEHVWENEYSLTYITGASTQADHTFEGSGLNYTPSEHLKNIVHAWSFCNDKELGATPPEFLTKIALQRRDDRMVIHYNQPHAPYIGDYRLRDIDHDISKEESQIDIYEKIGRYGKKNKTISDSELRKAYRSNLRRALSSVEELVSKLNRPVVVTSDHGELLGEDGRYIHGGPQHRHLCEIPWYTVNESILGTEDVEDFDEIDEADEDFTERDIEEQLRHLGYV